jgi:uncharacterized membrane protein
MNTRERRLLVALVVSGSLNLLLIGFVVARIIGHHPHPPPGPGPFHARAMFDLGRSPELRAELQQQKEKLQPKHRALRAARSEVEQALLAEPYDRARVERALGALRQATTAMQEGMHTALLDIAANLDPEQRRALVRENFGRDRSRGPGPRRPE